jgi:hypothetical protein
MVRLPLRPHRNVGTIRAFSNSTDLLGHAVETRAMWDRAKVLLDWAPFYPVVRPLAGVVLGLFVGGLYGALCGALHAALRSTPALFLGWFLPAAGAGATAGFIMGVYSMLDRATLRPAVPPEPKCHRDGGVSIKGQAMAGRVLAWSRLRRLAVLPLAGLLAHVRGTPVA